MLWTVLNSLGPGFLRILRRTAPIHQELPILVELRDTGAAVAIADEERAVRQPIDVGRPIEQLAGVAAALALGAERHHELAVVGELEDDMQLIIDHPHVLLGIVRAHLDLVRPAAAGHLEELVVLRPRLHHLAGAVDDENHVVVAALPTAFLRRFTRRAEAIVIARRVAARRIEQRVWRPRLRAGRQRQFAALRDPDPIGGFCVDSAHRAPGPAIVLDAVGAIRQRLRPVLDELVRTELFLAAFLLGRAPARAALVPGFLQDDHNPRPLTATPARRSPA